MTGLSSKELNQMRDAVGDLFPDRCHLLSATRTSDSQGGFVEAWGTVTRSVPCRMDQMTGAERLTDGSLRSFTSLELALPYDTTVEDGYRVEHGGYTYHVVNANLDQSWQVERVVLLEKLS